MTPQRNRQKGDRFAAKERRAMIFELRRAGAGYKEIADKLGIGLATVHRHIHAGLAEWRMHSEQDAEAIIVLEESRLDRLLRALWPAASKGDLRAIDRAIRIMERRAAYRGLDAPKKVAPTDPGGTQPYSDPRGLTDDQRAERIAAILDAARARRAG